MDKMVENILAFVVSHDYVSFAELDRRVEGFSGGDMSLILVDNPTLVFWIGISKDGVAALEVLSKCKLIKYEPCGVMCYFIDGAVPRMLAAKRLNYRYKKPRWLPMVVRPTLKGQQLIRDLAIPRRLLLSGKRLRATV